MLKTNEEIDLPINFQEFTNIAPSDLSEKRNENKLLVLCQITNDSLSEICIISLKILEFTNTHPQCDNKPVINNIKWDSLPDISNPDTATSVAKFIFKPKLYWINKTFLYNPLKVFASNTGFTPKCIDITLFGCNCCGK